MAVTVLAVTQIPYTGVAKSLTAANTDGHTIVNDGRTFIEVANGAGAPINVTVATSGTIDGRAIGDDVVAVTNGTTKLIGPWPVHLYNDSGGLVTVTFSSVTTITCAAFKL